MEERSGYVEHIIYRNEENGYTVLNLVCEEEEITCVGIFPVLGEGENLKVSGELTLHPSYGEQLKVAQFQVCAPEDIISIERYLGSGAIRGIGIALASRIVRKFKGDTFRIMEEEPERLAEVKGISENKAREIGRQVTEKKEMREAVMFLQQYGISLKLSVKIYRTYGMAIYGIIRENPYKLADDIDGIGFRIADEIAAKVGIRTDSDFRLRSGILYTLTTAAQEGHTFLPKEELEKRAEALLGVEKEQLEIHFVNLVMDRKVILCQQGEETCLYAAPYYYTEAHAAEMLQALNLDYAISQKELEKTIASIEEDIGITLDPLQAEGIKAAAAHGLVVITGGPGTGKTTTLNAMIRYFEKEKMDILLAAPTGRAAKRMSETTGYRARTIHRLLEVSGGLDGDGTFGRDESNPLETDVVIIDEVSMVDIHLMYSLLKAVVPGTRLILVGDQDQLPSVGPGSVLRDIIASEQFPVVRLNHIFRQAEESDIIVNAHKINRGEEVAMDNRRDFFFLKRYDAEEIIGVMLYLIQKKLPGFVDARPEDIQVLTPMRKGLLRVERLNQVLQEYLNPPSPEKKEKELGGILFREGDKVMQIKNNYQLEWEVRGRYNIPIEKGMGIFNGDMGVVRKIEPFSEIMTVEFDEGRMVDYSFKDTEELEHAYAITIHKSQGSEYPAVILPLLGGPRPLMTRNLLYTAVTRARKCVTLVGSDVTFQAMIQNKNEKQRYSGLIYRLTE